MAIALREKEALAAIAQIVGQAYNVGDIRSWLKDPDTRVVALRAVDAASRQSTRSRGSLTYAETVDAVLTGLANSLPPELEDSPPDPQQEEES